MTKITANVGAFKHTHVVLRYHHLRQHPESLRKEIAQRVQHDAQERGHIFIYIGPERTVTDYFISLDMSYSRTKDYIQTLQGLSETERGQIGLIAAKTSNDFSTQHPPKSIRSMLPKRLLASDETITTASVPVTAIDEGSGDASRLVGDLSNASSLETSASEASPDPEENTAMLAASADADEDITFRIYLKRDDTNAAPPPPKPHRYAVIPGEETVEHAPTLDSERGTSRKLNPQSTDYKEELASPGIADRYAKRRSKLLPHQVHLLCAAAFPPSPPSPPKESKQAAHKPPSEAAKEANQSTQKKSPSLILSRILEVDSSQSSQNTSTPEPG